MVTQRSKHAWTVTVPSGELRPFQTCFDLRIGIELLFAPFCLMPVRKKANAMCPSEYSVSIYRVHRVGAHVCGEVHSLKAQRQSTSNCPQHFNFVAVLYASKHRQWP